MGRLDFRRPPKPEQRITEPPASEDRITEAPPSRQPVTDSRQRATESHPRGAPEWLVASMEAQRVRRETKAREAREAAERASLEAERRIEELKRRILEHHSFKDRFAEAAERLERRLGHVEVRIQTAERRAARAERVAGLDPDQLEQLRPTKGVEPRDGGQSNPKIEPSQPSGPIAENGSDGNAHSDRSRRVVG